MTEPQKLGVVLGPSRPRSLRDALGEVALALPERVAISDDHSTLTYEGLLRAIDRVASAVRGENAAAVTVVVEHGIEAVVAILGVITAGRIAVPVDARDPLERLAAIHDDATSSLVVTNQRCVTAARSLAAGSPMLVTEDLPDAEPPEPAPSGPAMLLFTSGSTGTPKGVAIGEESIVHNALQFAVVHGLTPDDRIAVPGSLSFGASLGRVFAALVSGARVCLYDLRERGPGGITEWVNANGITVMFFVPSVLRAVLEHSPDARMDTVRLVTFGGEPLYGRDTRRARALFGPTTVFRNRLSSAESHGMASRFVTALDDELDATVPVGEIEPWLDARIVDDDDHDVPHGKSGRLVVIGRDFALGYWQDPELTAERFVDLPDGRRAFYTSDVVRRREDGALEHVGRADDRVKVRGAMVSPTEVEHALVQLEGVAEAAVKGIPAADGGLRLVAYVVPERGASPSASSIRRDLATVVPPTMVPGTVVMLDALPIDPRGKLDRGALPPPPTTNRPYRAPAGREEELAAIFRDVLGVDRIGLDDDFFELGGDSLASVEVIAAIDDHFSVELSGSALLESPTVGALAPRLVRRRVRGAPTVVPLRRSGAGTPFFCVAGGGSPATSLRALAECIEDRPCYGIQARGLEERARPDHSVEACARRYLAEIRAIQPSGPYLFGGFSFGGLVAFEMACQLQAAGEQVGLLAILEVIAPGRKPNAAARRAKRLEGTSLAARLRKVPRAIAGHAQRGFELASAGLLRRRLRQYRVFFLLSQRARERYQPTARFDGPTLVVRSSIPDADEPRPDEPDLGWGPFVSGPLTTTEVTGDHVGIMRRPYVATLGRELGCALDHHSAGN